MVIRKLFAVVGWYLFFMLPGILLEASEMREAASPSAAQKEEISAVQQARQLLDARRVQESEAIWGVYILAFIALGASLFAIMVRIFFIGGRKPVILDSAAELEKARSHRKGNQGSER